MTSLKIFYTLELNPSPPKNYPYLGEMEIMRSLGCQCLHIDPLRLLHNRFLLQRTPSIVYIQTLLDAVFSLWSAPPRIFNLWWKQRPICRRGRILKPQFIPANHKRRQKGKSLPGRGGGGVITGPVSNLTVKCGCGPWATWTKEWLQCKLQTRLLVREDDPLYNQGIFRPKERKGKNIVVSPRGRPDSEREWPTTLAVS
jgi:hypothetical protein